jgi:RNA polymerase sigma factor (sigma-70 family)
METPEPKENAAHDMEAAPQWDPFTGNAEPLGGADAVVAAESTRSASESPELRTLYLRHHRSLYRAAGCVCRQREDAEDAVEDAFLGIARKVERHGWRIFARRGDDDSRSVLDPLSHAAARAHRYLLVAAVHRAINALHDSQRRVVDESEEDPDWIDPSTDPELCRTENEARAYVAELFRSVPPEPAALLYAHDAENVPFEDVSLIFHVPCGSLSRKLERARELVRVAAGLPPTVRKKRRTKPRARRR